MRTFAPLVVIGLIAAPLLAGDDGLAGNWKVMVMEASGPGNPWLISLGNKGGKWSGTAEGLGEMPETTIQNIRLAGDLIQFDLRVADKVTFQFEGKTPRAGAKKVLGSVAIQGKSIPAYLEATSAKNSFELDREVVTRTPNDPRVFNIVLDLIRQGKENKVSTKDVQEWVETAWRGAEGYGPRFQLDYALRLADLLAARADYAALAPEVAAKAAALTGPNAAPLQQMRVLHTWHNALLKSGQADKVNTVAARMEKLEEPAYAEYQKSALGFVPAKFKGRKSKSDRAVLVELFTGAMCPPCVAADLGFDALEKAFSSREVVLLQYHLHIPGPDALTNADAVKRADFYNRTLRGTPGIYFNGKPDAPGGGGRDDGEDKYKEYRETVEPLLEKPAGVQLQARAVRKSDKIAVQVSVAGLEKPGETMRLRLALVEDWVRYKGTNGTLYHHRVVRALPGGPAGMALMKKEVDHALVVDLQELRAGLTKYLDNYEKTEDPFPDAQRPMRFRNLRVVAFVQNDENNDVLQALDVPVSED